MRGGRSSSSAVLTMKALMSEFSSCGRPSARHSLNDEKVESCGMKVALPVPCLSPQHPKRKAAEGVVCWERGEGKREVTLELWDWT